jgi:glycosyltransferase involved in cell wall biosynthesis
VRIGIDISQLAYPGTGVANYLGSLVSHLLEADKKNEYVLFYSSLRSNFQFSIYNFQSNSTVSIKQFKFPQTLLNILWNKLHVLPIDRLIGNVDLFITSDWIEPPMEHGKKATIIYDMVVFKHTSETDRRIVETQKRKLKWVKKESDAVFTISEASKRDIVEILGIEPDKIKVIYPGISIS